MPASATNGTCVSPRRPRLRFDEGQIGQRDTRSVAHAAGADHDLSGVLRSGRLYLAITRQNDQIYVGALVAFMMLTSASPRRSCSCRIFCSITTKRGSRVKSGCELVNQPSGGGPWAAACAPVVGRVEFSGVRSLSRKHGSRPRRRHVRDSRRNNLRNHGTQRLRQDDGDPPAATAARELRRL